MPIYCDKKCHICKNFSLNFSLSLQSCGRTSLCNIFVIRIMVWKENAAIHQRGADRIWRDRYEAARAQQQQGEGEGWDGHLASCSLNLLEEMSLDPRSMANATANQILMGQFPEQGSELVSTHIFATFPPFPAVPPQRQLISFSRAWESWAYPGSLSSAPASSSSSYSRSDPIIIFHQQKI